MPPSSAGPEAVILAASLGAVGVITVGLIQGIFLFRNSDSQRRHEQRQAIREGRRDRRKIQAEAVETCIETAVRFRSAAHAYDQANPDSELAYLKAEAKLEAASERLADQSVREKIESFRDMTRRATLGEINASILHEKWQEVVQALGTNWHGELIQGEVALNEDHEETHDISRPTRLEVGYLLFVAAVLSIFLNSAGHDLWGFPYLIVWIVSNIPFVAHFAWLVYHFYRTK